MNEDIEKKSLLRIISEGSFIFVAGNFILKAAIILSTVFILRYVSVYDYGVWRLVLGVLGGIGLITLPTLNDVAINDLSRELGRKKEDTYRALFKKISIIIFAFCLLAGAVLFIFAPFISYFTGIEITFALRVISFSFIFLSFQRIYILAFHSRLQFLHLQGMRIIDRIAYLVFIIIFILFFKKGLEGVVYAYLFSVIPSLILYLPSFIKAVRQINSAPFDTQFSIWSILRTHGKWAFLSDYLETIFSSLRPWMIGYFLGVETVAVVYVAAALVTEVATLLPLSQILSPIIPREINNEIRFEILFKKGIKYLLWFYICAAVAAFITAPFLIKLFFPHYLSSLGMFNILLLSLVALPFSSFTERAFYAFQEQKRLFFSTVVSLPISLGVILPIFITFFGVVGVAWEQVITAFLFAWVRIRFLKGVFPGATFLFSDFLKYDKDDKVLLARVLAGVRRRFIHKNI